MLDKIKEIISETTGADVSTITESTSFKDDLGSDSLELFELVMALEEEYNVEIPTEDLEQLKTVGDILDYLNKLV
ncbi:MAG: acyl carrier protein [Lachnospiraceae bacterium]|nr:acyl carrier protein [Lachnospira sp.]MBQ8729740.1 acyl carrier protein [Lachnospiraceae bacterium]MBR6698138.1 acyl carrier protein [Lachnospiraceae bacterium]